MKDFQVSGTINSPREAMELLFRRRWPIVTMFIAFVVISTLYVFFWPPTYRASVRFMIKNSRQESTITGDQTSIHLGQPLPVSEEDLNSEADILLSHTVLENTVTGAGIDTMPEHWLIRLLKTPLDDLHHFYNQYHGKPDRTPFEQGVIKLARNASASVEQRSDILTLNVDWGDPRVATMIADTMAKNYLIQHLAVRKNPEAVSAFFEQQLNEKHEELERIGTQIRATSPAGSLSGLVHERNNIQDEASTVDKDLSSDRANLARLKSQLQAQDAVQSRTPGTLLSSERSVFNAAALSSLRLQVVELERKRVELLQKFQPNNRLVQQNAKELQVATAALKDASDSPGQERTTTVNPVTQMLQENSAGDSVAAAGTDAHRAALGTEQMQILKRLSELNRQSLPLEQLELEKKVNEDSYLAYARQYEENRINGALDSNQFSNVVMIEPVRAGNSPIKPNAKLIFELSVPLGLLLAIGFGVLLELLDHTIKSPADVGPLNVPILATFRFVHSPAAPTNVP